MRLRYDPNQLTEFDLLEVDEATAHYSPKNAIRRMLRKAEARTQRPRSEIVFEIGPLKVTAKLGVK